MTKKIFSYNVNGIRAAISKGFVDWLEEEAPDIVLIQETKAQPEQIDNLYFKQLGYHCYCHSAKKKGYSGVAILSKTEPDNLVYGMGIDKYDDEGRVLRADFHDISIFSTYFPSGSSGDIRQDVKMEFLSDFQSYIKGIQKERPNIIIGGDCNICHKPIDINNPKRHKKSSGFLPEEREWFDGFIESGFVDTFRMFNQEPEQYSWWSYRANSRAKNLGWRIDYHLVSNNITNRLKDAFILQNVVHSDHCPVGILFDM